MERVKNLRLIFLEALENLLAEEFDRFKYALTCIECDGGGKIPKCRLEEANTRMKLVDFMCSYCCEDVAVKTAICALELMKMRDAAANLRVKRAKVLDLEQLEEADYRVKYSEHIQNQYKVIKDMNSRLGENVNLNSRYTKLIIVKEHRSKKEREHEIMDSGRRHAEIMTKRASSITINGLFDPDEDGQIPPIVVLQGAAGIGKTMTAKKIMFDWAVGELYQSRFDYVFYINCREINSGIEQGSVADLILKNCPDQNAPVDKILRNPEKLLFIIDGFDELRFSFAQSESNLCSDPFKKQPAAIILSSLFRKKVLSKSYLIVTTRPTALEELQQYLQGERYADILGFTEAEREEYFYKFFKNEEKARKAFNFVKDNEMLFTMCFVPIVCWIICTVLNQQMEEGKDLAQNSETITGMYMLYLFSLLKGHSSNSKQQIQVNWKGLCSLAADGIWRQKILFEEEEIKKHGLDMSDSLFLNENVFLKYNDTECVYSFIHLSLQEFFAALFYVLEKEDTMVEESETAVNNVQKLLENYGKSRNYLTLTVRFLFGLLNTEAMEAINKKIKCKISSKIKPDLLKWIKNKLKISSLSWKSDEELSPLKNAEMIYLLEEFHCLYEIQEQSFVQSALNHFTELNLAEYNFSKMDQVALSFCLKNCCKLETLNLNLCLFGFEDPNKDFPRPSKQQRLELHQDESNHSDIYLLCQALKEPNCKLKKLKLTNGHLTAACYKDLFSAVRTKQTLTVLDLSMNNLGELEARLLCEGLKGSCCKLQRLVLSQCYLTAACCGDLSSVLSTKPSLTELDLTQNKLEDSGMKLLCVGLTHLNCKLQKLGLMNCGLTASSCGDLASVLSVKPTLTELDLALNNLGEAEGMKHLCEGLKHPDCKLQKLRLMGCQLTVTCCRDLSSIFSINQTLTELELRGNLLRDSGVQLLCEGLKHPNCKLQKLGLKNFLLTGACCEDLAAVLSISGSLIELELGIDHLGDSGVQLLCEGLKHPDCKLQRLELWGCVLTAACCGDLSSALSTSQNLAVLELGYNKLRDSGVQLLCEGLEHTNCKLQKIKLEHCSLTAACCGALSSVLSISQTLTELDLKENKLGDSGVQLLCEGLRHSNCRLHKICLGYQSVAEETQAELDAMKDTKPDLVIEIW
ncbi:NACHT, LRR and PYD domains-containing protein 3-like [Mauremys mutica]|uniref:NACHT, LRR and PYD domains-containing protein 3-like n=1 Tax=Mauremys mutica TaxID=74926 RepID=UPI001D15E42A|nr:NACHT, LRR and PYD domains-containing protein 3-like [Mauremys mutica]